MGVSLVLKMAAMVILASTQNTWPAWIVCVVLSVSLLLEYSVKRGPTHDNSKVAHSEKQAALKPLEIQRTQADDHELPSVRTDTSPPLLSPSPRTPLDL